MKTKKIKKFSKAIKKFLEQEGEVRTTPFKDFYSKIIIDKKNLQFLLVQHYYDDKDNFDYRLVYHLEIKEGKIVILKCNIDTDVIREFNYLGILAKYITSANAPKYLRELNN